MIGNLENLDCKNMQFINRLGIYFYSIFVQVEDLKKDVNLSILGEYRYHNENFLLQLKRGNYKLKINKK